ncbi:MAG: NAD(P)-dependent alcohol dehydrogenase [Planctomycetes bacterium]|nr:NAD(P)-dependent alcohol dehydrogenase [Planctomycetota bacterium]
MLKTPAYAAPAVRAPLAPFSIDRREPGSYDVLIDILFCGVCHSDIHQVRDEWTGSTFPMVPGHEIIGRVKRIGDGVGKFNVGDIAGVGCFVDSCRECEYCRRGVEQFCDKTAAFTYNGTEMDRKTPTHGGYSTQIVVDERYVLRIPSGLALAAAAPLLCAGITTYSPLREWKCKKGDRVGVVGLGGLGHMAVKIAAAMGAEVTVLSTSPAKENDARRLGAHGFALTKSAGDFEKLAGRFHLVIDTISAPHDVNSYLLTLRALGTMVLVGLPGEPMPLAAAALVMASHRLAGSSIGGIAETQEMLDFCAAHKIVSDVEVIPIQKINEAYERMIKSDVKYRFVIDVASLKK